MAEAELPMLSPTVGRRWLAQELRRLREAAGRTQADVAERLRCKAAKIAHIESMRNSISAPDLEVVLPYLGVPENRIGWYLNVCERSKEKGWWEEDRSLPDWLSLYVGLEAGAREIRMWSTGLVPELFQTFNYSFVLYPEDAAISRAQRRQQSLQRKAYPATVHAVLDEAVLWREVGTRQVAVEQLERFVELVERPNVTIQVLPFGPSDRRTGLGSFSLLGFSHKGDPGTAFTESPLGGSFADKPEELAVFEHSFADLAQQALSPAASADLIAKKLKQVKQSK